MEPLLPPVNGLNATKMPSSRTERLWSVARDLEAAFLAEMLRTAGAGKARESFGGGTGEDQFASLLSREYATSVARSGGIGLSEAIYRSLARGEEGST